MAVAVFLPDSIWLWRVNKRTIWKYDDKFIARNEIIHNFMVYHLILYCLKIYPSLKFVLIGSDKSKTDFYIIFQNFKS